MFEFEIKFLQIFDANPFSSNTLCINVENMYLNEQEVLC